MVALSPKPKETVNAATLANCRPSPISHNSVFREHDRKYSGHDARQLDDDGAEGETNEGCDKQELERQTSVQFLDHEGAVAGGDRRQAGHGYFVTWVFRTDSIEGLVEAFDDRQKLAGIDIWDAAGNQHRVLFGRNEATRQVLWKYIDILLQGHHVRLAGLLGKPAPQCLERPHIGDAGLLLDRCVHCCDRGQRFRVIK